MSNFRKKSLLNAISANEVVIRHILDHQYDDVRNEVKTSAFQLDHLKAGLSLTVKSKLNNTLRTKVIADVEKTIFAFKCDFEATASGIRNIVDENGNGVYELYLNTIGHHPAHAEVKFSTHIASAKPSIHRKYRMVLMNEFFVSP